MIHNYAMLGETPELFKETEEWVKQEMKKIKKNEETRKQVLENVQPLLEQKRKKLLSSQK